MLLFMIDVVLLFLLQLLVVVFPLCRTYRRSRMSFSIKRRSLSGCRISSTVPRSWLNCSMLDRFHISRDYDSIGDCLTCRFASVSDGGRDPSGFQQLLVAHSDRTGRFHGRLVHVDRPHEVYRRNYGLDVHHRRFGHASIWQASNSCFIPTLVLTLTAAAMQIAWIIRKSAGKSRE